MAPIVFNRPVSPTPNSVMGEVTDNICKQWDIEDAYQALSNGLSYNHASYAMAWGEPFLILLSELASLTPGRLGEVQESLRKRIDRGRKTKVGRQPWVMPADLKALIARYGRARLRPAGPPSKRQRNGRRCAIEQQEVEHFKGETACDEPEVKKKYTSNDPQRPVRTSNTRKRNTAADEIPDADYIPSSRRDSSPNAITTTPATVGRKRKRGSYMEQPYHVDASDGAQEEEPGRDQVQKPGTQQTDQHKLQMGERQNDGQAPGQRGEREQHVAGEPDRHWDILSWRAGLPSGPIRQAPPTIVSVSDDLGGIGLEKAFTIPREATPARRIAMLQTLRRRNQSMREVNMRDVEDAEFDFQIQREEVKLTRQNHAGAGT